MRIPKTVQRRFFEEAESRFGKITNKYCNDTTCSCTVDKRDVDIKLVKLDGHRHSLSFKRGNNVIYEDNYLDIYRGSDSIFSFINYCDKDKFFNGEGLVGLIKTSSSRHRNPRYNSWSFYCMILDMFNTDPLNCTEGESEGDEVVWCDIGDTGLHAFMRSHKETEKRKLEDLEITWHSSEYEEVEVSEEYSFRLTRDDEVIFEDTTKSMLELEEELGEFLLNAEYERNSEQGTVTSEIVNGLISLVNKVFKRHATFLAVDGSRICCSIAGLCKSAVLLVGEDDFEFSLYDTESSGSIDDSKLLMSTSANSLEDLCNEIIVQIMECDFGLADSVFGEKRRVLSEKYATRVVNDSHKVNVVSALTIHGKKVAYRFELDCGCVDVSTLKWGLEKTASIVELQEIEGYWVSPEEIDKNVVYPDISENMNLLKRLREILSSSIQV